MIQVGDIVGQYTIIGQIGSGGMATVYKAYHGKLDRYVAIKVMRDIFAQDHKFLGRFQREARIIARLEHPHIVSVYDYAEHENQPYLVMQHVDGGTLKRRFIKQGMTLSDIQTMMTTLADALTYAHEKGVLHRDIKPSNILIDARDMPYITDFGLASIAQLGESTISHDVMLGTPFYISPEQAKGETPLTPATDVYSFGVVLYELLVGTVPFSADTPYAIIHNHIYNKPTPPSHINPELTPAIDAVMARALAKNPDDRYQTASQLMQAFNKAIDGSGVTALPPDRSTVDYRQHPVYGASKKRVQADGALDMGNFSLSELGKKLDETIRSGVDYVADLANHIDGKSKPTQEELIRKRIERKLHARRELYQHMVVYFVINTVLWWIYLNAIGLGNAPISEIRWGFPWPIFPSVFWGMGLVTQYIDYYFKHGRGADKQEAEIEAELARRRGQMPDADQRKGHYQPSAEDYDVFDIDDVAVRRVRLNADGELTDSFVQDVDANQRQARR